MGLLGSGRSYASPVFADEVSLSNGAQLYEQYCSECHGRDPADRSGGLYRAYETEHAVEDSELIDVTGGEELSQATELPDDDEWPEWAERPNPAKASEPDAEAEVLNALITAIDEAHRVKPESDESGNYDGSFGIDTGGGFAPIPGATDLSTPQAYFYGTSEEEVFDSIANGTGAAMPGWRTELGSEEAIWDLVNYIRSFWAEEWLY
jgi:mono/diheme cytochrome c family protein